VLKKVVNYVDFEGKERSDTLYFNLTEPEVVRLDVQFEGGLEEYINNLDVDIAPENILNLFERVIKASYGEKGEDGRHFIKNEEMMDMFNQSAAYAALFVELVQNADQAAIFFNGLLSKTTVEKVAKVVSHSPSN
jgi:hypothetical protein